MPSTPENGARMVLRWITALISPSCASLCWNSAVARSNSAFEITFSLQQLLHAREGEPRQLAASFDRRELRLLLPGIENGEHVAGAHRAPGIEENPLDRARKIGADGHALHRRHRADRAQRDGPLFLLRHHGGHGLRRRLEGRALRDGRLDLLELHEAQARDDHHRHGQHADHSLQHFSASFGSTVPAFQSSKASTLEPWNPGTWNCSYRPTFSSTPA